jgi:DNA repair protein RadC
MMTIQAWPTDERPREKLHAKGATALSDAELLAVVIRVGTRGKTAVDVARDLLVRFGSLTALFAADASTVCQVPGVGLTRHAQFQAIVELARRALAESMACRDVMSNPTLVARYLRLTIGLLPHEVFHALYLNTQHHVLRSEELFRGTLSQTQVYPRDIVARALAANAAAVIVAHNHPSGNCEPSADDIRITERIKSALALVDIRLLDHVIVTAAGTTSLAERGLV